MGFECEIDFRSVLFPAFGKPTNPISAISFKSKLTGYACPLVPKYPFLGLPPEPPLAIIKVSFSLLSSPRIHVFSLLYLVLFCLAKNIK